MSYIQDSNPKLPANDWFTPGIKKRNAFVAPKSGKASCVSSYWESVATPMVSITGYIYPHQIHSTEVLFADVQFNKNPLGIGRFPPPILSKVSQSLIGGHIVHFLLLLDFACFLLAHIYNPDKLSGSLLRHELAIVGLC